MRQAHIQSRQIGIDLTTHRINFDPGLITVWLGHTRRFPDAGHLHAVLELTFAFIKRTGHRRSRPRVGRTSYRNMPFASEQARGRIQPDPAGARQIHFAPGVQVGEIDFRARGAVERFDIGRQLDQVAGHKAGCQPQVTQDLHEQPGRITARTRALGQRFFWRLHTRFHADGVANVLLQTLIQPHQKIDRADFLMWDRREIGAEFRRGRQAGTIRLQFMRLLGGIRKWKNFRFRLQEEIEGVMHGHFGDEIHFDPKIGRLLREDHACQIIGLRVLLPVNEVLTRHHPHGVTENARTRMRTRPQPDDLRPQIDGAIITVMGDVIEGNVDRHSATPERSLGHPPSRKSCANARYCCPASVWIECVGRVSADEPTRNDTSRASSALVSVHTGFGSALKTSFSFSPQVVWIWSK